MKLYLKPILSDSYIIILKNFGIQKKKISDSDNTVKQMKIIIHLRYQLL